MEVTGIDNRGTPEMPYGFVYFDDDTRVGYAPGVDDGPEVWPFAGPHWKPATELHVRKAREYLEAIGIEFGVKH